MKGFTKCCISNAVDETDDDMLWNKSEEDGSARKKKAPIFKIETVTLIGKGTQNVTCFVYQVFEITSKIFLLSRCFIFRGLPQILINTFSLGRHILFGGVILD